MQRPRRAGSERKQILRSHRPAPCTKTPSGRGPAPWFFLGRGGKVAVQVSARMAREMRAISVEALNSQIRARCMLNGLHTVQKLKDERLPHLQATSSLAP